MDNKKRIAIISSSFPPLGGGGVSSSHFNLFLSFKKKGFNVHGFTINDGGTGDHANEPEITRGGLPPLLDKLINRALFILLRLSGEKGNIYQLSDALTGALAGIFLFKKIRRFKPHIVILPDHGAPGAFMPKLMECSTILISHHNPIRFVDEPLLGLHSRRDSEWALKLEKMVLSKVDGVICPSDHMKETFLKTFSFAGKVDVIPNLIDRSMVDQISASSLHERSGLSKDAPIVYIPSAGSVYKGSRFVFEIIRRLASDFPKGIGFYLSGEIGADLERSLTFLPENVRLIKPGKIAYRKNIANIKACILCVSPTLIESFGMALLEAQACGIPVVTFDAGGNKGIVKEGETGYIVPFADLEALISSSKKLLSNRELCSDFSDKALNHVRKDFNEDGIIDKFLHFSSNLS